MPRKPPMPRHAKRRRVCFVTGTRAEFGLMRSTLVALRDHPAIELQLIATGVHTHRSRGHTVDEIVADSWRVDATLPWADASDPVTTAAEMGRVTGALASAFARLESDVVLVVGDRVEAFAAAAAAHVSGRFVAHVHGGDRALGQADDSLRHAISKLAHVHFAATRASGERLFKMGEDRRRIHVVGAPGLDGIREAVASGETIARDVAPLARDAFVLFLLHPTTADDAIERRLARRLIARVRSATDLPIVALLPNNDAGANGIADALRDASSRGRVTLLAHARRDVFLGLLRDARCLVGNSSAGIIEAGAFGTPVLDVGPRQAGRERGSNVVGSAWDVASLERRLRVVVAGKRGSRRQNPYRSRAGGAGVVIARTLADVEITGGVGGKLIRY